VFLAFWNVIIYVIRVIMLEIRNELAKNSGCKISWKNLTLKDPLTL